jgi:hypothetical protein
MKWAHLRLTFYRSNWYLAAWCHEREEMRIFSVDRVSAPCCMAEAVYDPPADLVAAKLDSSYGIFTGKADKTAVLRLRKLAARWVAEAEWHPGVKSEPQRDGAVILRIPYKHEPELVMDILRHGPNVEVLGPASMRKTVGEALTTAATRYAERLSMRLITAISGLGLMVLLSGCSHVEDDGYLAPPGQETFDLQVAAERAHLALMSSIYDLVTNDQDCRDACDVFERGFAQARRLQITSPAKYTDEFESGLWSHIEYQEGCRAYALKVIALRDRYRLESQRAS